MHLEQLRELASEKASKHGLYRGKKLIASASEADIYEALGLQFIAPELREGRGEIILAAKHKLPDLVQDSDAEVCVLATMLGAIDWGLPYNSHYGRAVQFGGQNPRAFYSGWNPKLSCRSIKLAVPDRSPPKADLNDVRNLGARAHDELEKFFLATNALEEKEIVFLGWRGPKHAIKTIKQLSER